MFNPPQCRIFCFFFLHSLLTCTLSTCALQIRRWYAVFSPPVTGSLLTGNYKSRLLSWPLYSGKGHSLSGRKTHTHTPRLPDCDPSTGSKQAWIHGWSAHRRLRCAFVIPGVFVRGLAESRRLYWFFNKSRLDQEGFLLCPMSPGKQKTSSVWLSVLTGGPVSPKSAELWMFEMFMTSLSAFFTIRLLPDLLLWEKSLWTCKINNPEP